MPGDTVAVTGGSATKTAVVQANGTWSVSVSFSRSGRYTLICTKPGHARKGMKAGFTVGRG